MTVLPFDELDHAISGMGNHWLIIVYAASFAVIAMLLYIFRQYLKLFRNHVSELKDMNAEMDAARRAVEPARKEAEHANAAKQEFLSSMSHDIRTPMNAIIGRSSLAADNAHDPERVQKYLGKIALSSKHLLGLINDILDMSKKAEEREMDVALPGWNALVVDGDERLCVNAVHALESIGIRAEWCLSAEQAMEQIAEHPHQNDSYQLILLSWKLPGMNGIEAAQAIRSSCGEDSPALLLSACDWSGVEEEAREAGISGFISKPLFKSTLFDALKAFSGTATEEAANSEKAVDLVLRGKRILLAEDNELNWEVARELLSVLEMELDWVENGQLCVAKFEEAPVGYYNAILMDVRMPIMDGYEATMAIPGARA